MVGLTHHTEYSSCNPNNPSLSEIFFAVNFFNWPACHLYSWQLMIASEDMTFHTAKGPVDVTNISDSMYFDTMGIRPIAGGHEPATIGHFMGGYDAGYYSYLWSKVYALNIFDKFERDGLTNATTGAEYRRWILEQGNMQDGNLLLRGFLEKDPSVDVFYERLHINATVKLQ